MGLRFQRRIRLASGLFLNVSKRGVSLSFGRPGATINIGGKGEAEIDVAELKDADGDIEVSTGDRITAMVVSTSGGNAKNGDVNAADESGRAYPEGYGQIWEYHLDHGELQLLYQSPGGSVLDSPDNMAVSPRGGIVLCEDDASDGNAAIAKMRDKKYGLVISDWNMEPMTGYELLRQVRNEDAIAETPFIMVTAESKTENVIAAKKAGVNNYIVKPFNAQTLKSKIEAACAA